MFSAVKALAGATGRRTISGIVHRRYADRNSLDSSLHNPLTLRQPRNHYFVDGVPEVKPHDASTHVRLSSHFYWEKAEQFLFAKVSAQPETVRVGQTENPIRSDADGR